MIYRGFGVWKCVWLPEKKDLRNNVLVAVEDITGIDFFLDIVKA